MREKKWERDGMVAKNIMAPLGQRRLERSSSISLGTLVHRKHCAKCFRVSQKQPYEIGNTISTIYKE